jgi:hypothetical protein
MDSAKLMQMARDAWAGAETLGLAYPGIASAGLLLAAAIALWGLLRVATVAVKLIAMLRRAARVSKTRRIPDFGARLLVARGRGLKAREAARALAEALKEHMAPYMFGGSYRVIEFPGAVVGEARAEALLRSTGADVIVWTEVQRRGRLLARMASRSASSTDAARPPQAWDMPRRREAWTPPLMRALAYAAAKQYRPALGRPQDFRAERLQPVVETLLSVLADKPAADPRLLTDMTDDVAAGALQLAYAGQPDWLDRSVEIARATLTEVNRGASPDRWISAKVTLGRALKLRCERKFDPVLLQEAITHLNEALEALRSEPRFKLAEAAAQTIGEAQKMLGARRRFSISGGRI